jgi:hypothetical protein
MKQIEAVQDKGYGKHEYDILNADGYCGLLIGTETRNGIIWEVQRYRNGNPDGSVMRLPVMSFEQAMQNAESFLV